MKKEKWTKYSFEFEEVELPEADMIDMVNGKILIRLSVVFSFGLMSG